MPVIISVLFIVVLFQSMNAGWVLCYGFVALAVCCLEVKMNDVSGCVYIYDVIKYIWWSPCYVNAIIRSVEFDLNISCCEIK